MHKLSYLNYLAEDIQNMQTPQILKQKASVTSPCVLKFNVGIKYQSPDIYR